MSIEVLTKNDIKQMLKLDDANTSIVVGMPSFPAPVLDLSQKARRWLRGPVEEWLKDQYEKNKRKRDLEASDYMKNVFNTLPTKLRTE